MNSIGNKIKNLRLSKNETQKDLADALCITYQSISKWENGINTPSIDYLKQLSIHFGVDINYFLEVDNKSNEIEEFSINTKINEEAPIMLWTDFLYNYTIAPASVINNGYHVPGKRYLKTHPAPKDYLVIAVDMMSEICFLSKHCNYFLPTCGPDGFFYSKIDGMKNNNPCLVVESSYDNRRGCKDFEFVIPNDGFVLALPWNTVEAKSLIEFIVPNRLKKIVKYNYNRLVSLNNQYPSFNKSFFTDHIFIGELNNIKVSLKGNSVIFIKEKVENNEEEQTFQNDLNIWEEIERLNHRIDALQTDIDNLGDGISDSLKEAIGELITIYNKK